MSKGSTYGGIIVIIGLILFIDYWWVFLVAGLAVALCFPLGMWLDGRRIAKVIQESKEREAAYNADAQNLEYLMTGNYEGNYPAETMPITTPYNYRNYVEDPDTQPDWHEYIRPNNG